MGTCKTNCCGDKQATCQVEYLEETNNGYHVQSDNNFLDPNKAYDLHPSKTIDKYDNTIYSTAGSLFNPEVYEYMIGGKKLDRLVIQRVSNLNCNTLFILLDYMFETILNFSKFNLDEFSVTILNYFKLSLKKAFGDLNNILPLPEDSNGAQMLLYKSLVNFIELYHFIKHNQVTNKSGGNTMYKYNYWKGVTDLNNHMKKNILSCADCLVQLYKLICNKEIAKVVNSDSNIVVKIKETNSFLNSVFVKAIAH